MIVSFYHIGNDSKLSPFSDIYAK